MKIYITSTLTCDQRYINYNNTLKHGVNTPVEEVVIKGGSNVSDPLTLAVRVGTQTEVSEEQLAMLEKNPVFQLHKKNGFIVVSKKEDVLKVVEDMAKEDSGAQNTEKKFRKRHPRVQASKQ